MIRKSSRRTSRSEIKGRRLLCQSSKGHILHTYRTRKTVPAEEREDKFHNHGKLPSYQTVADALMRKFMPKSNESSSRG